MNLAFWALIFLTSQYSEASPPCETSIDLDVNTIEICEAKKNGDEIIGCLEKIFGSNGRVVLDNRSRLQKVAFKNPVCVNGVRLEPRPPDLLLSIERRLNVPIASNIKSPVTIGDITFMSATGLCGWHKGGHTTLPLAKKLAFIQKGTKVILHHPRCQSDSTITGSSVTLSEKTVICGMKLSKGTQFYDDVDGHYHFTALDSGEMLAPDKNDPNIADVYKIKKGLNYRNRNPADTPCAWKLSPPPTETEVD